MSNVDINVDRRTDGRTENRTPISHPATSRCDNDEDLHSVSSFFKVVFLRSISIPTIRSPNMRFLQGNSEGQDQTA